MMSSVVCLRRLLRGANMPLAPRFCTIAKAFDFNRKPLIPSKVASWSEKYTSSSSDTRQIMLKSVVECKTLTPTLHNILNKSRNGIAMAMLLRDDTKDALRKMKLSKDADHSHGKPLYRLLDQSLQQWLAIVMCDNAIDLTRITFEHSSGDMLEHVARGEAVHRIRSLSELKRRLHDGRRCYALLHAQLPSVPLAFIHIGLTNTLARGLKDINACKDMSQPKCAMFYSVNSPLPSLGGLDLAASLIKKSAVELKHQYPSLKTTCTLSPIPGFINWVVSLVDKINATDPSVKDTMEYLSHNVPGLDPVVDLVMKDDPSLLDAYVGSNGNALFYVLCLIKSLNSKSLFNHLSSGDTAWYIKNTTLVETMEKPLIFLASHYIINEKTASLEPLDPVARFHLRNGAKVLQVNYLANTSSTGWSSSASMMVNYQYDDDQEDNAYQFEITKTIAIAEPLQAMIK